MTMIKTFDLQDLPEFPKHQDQLAVVEREPLAGANAFFEKLMLHSFNVIGQVSRDNSLEDISDILADDIPTELQEDSFYKQWLSDMARVCEIFCDTLESNAVGFSLSTQRGCRRYHIDNVPMRLLVTYVGKGTEWLPDDAADRKALASGAPNEEIVKDPSARRFMNPWDITIFRGGPQGLLHRTPDAALNGPSILMRLDHESFWSNIIKQQQENAPLELRA